jgi:hypothetical protein
MKQLLHFISLFILGCHQPVNQPSEQKKIPKISLDFQNAPLKDVLNSIVKQSNFNLCYITEDVDSAGEKMTMFINNMTAEEAIMFVLKYQPNFKFERYDSTFIIGLKK